MNTSPLTTTPDRVPLAAQSRKAKLTVGLTISLLTVLLCLGLLEVTGYIWERNTAAGPLGWTLVASRRLDLERHGSSDHPYYLFRPNADYEWEGIPVHINSRGLRTEEVQVPKPADTYRVLNLGDSVAFGWEVRQEDTYGKQLEKMLNGRTDGRRYEVINAGVPAWNLEAERNFLLQEGLDYQPDLVVLDVTLVNDIYGQGPAVSEDRSVFQWMRDNTYMWPFLTTQMRFLLAKQHGPEAIPVLNPPREMVAYFPTTEDSPVWDTVWAYIDEMHQASVKYGAGFVVVGFPTAFQLNSVGHSDVPQRVLAQRATAYDIQWVDLLPVYQEACDAAAPDACEGYENHLFADVWMHPNPLGHRLTAETIVGHIP